MSTSTMSFISISLILAVFSLLAIVVMIKSKNKYVFIPIGLFILGVFLTYNYVSEYREAVKHGAFDINMPHVLNKNATETFPEVSEVPEDVKDSVILYSSLSCPGCVANIGQIQEEFKNINKEVYYVNPMTEYGRQIVSKYPVEQIPAAVYIDAKGNQEVFTLLDETGKINDLVMKDLQEKTNKQ